MASDWLGVRVKNPSELLCRRNEDVTLLPYHQQLVYTLELMSSSGVIHYRVVWKNLYTSPHIKLIPYGNIIFLFKWQNITNVLMTFSPVYRSSLQDNSTIFIFKYHIYFLSYILSSLTIKQSYISKSCTKYLHKKVLTKKKLKIYVLKTNKIETVSAVCLFE